MSSTLGYGAGITKIISSDDSVTVNSISLSNVVDLTDAGGGSGGDALLINGSNAMTANLNMDGNNLTNLTGFQSDATTGSMAYHDGTKFVNLTAGAENKVLSIVSSVPTWISPAAAASSLLLNGSSVMNSGSTIRGTYMELDGSLTTTNIVVQGGVVDLEGGSLMNLGAVGIIGADSAGSILVRGTSQYAALPLGTSGYILTARATDVSWQAAGSANALLINGSNSMTGQLHTQKNLLVDGTSVLTGQAMIDDILISGAEISASSAITISNSNNTTINPSGNLILSASSVSFEGKRATNLTMIGLSATAASGSLAIGNSTTSLTNAIAIGQYANALAQTVALGVGSYAGGPGVSIGNDTTSGGNGVSIGNGSYSPGQQVVSVGVDSQALYDKNIAIGYAAAAQSSSQTGIVVGHSSTTTGSNSVVIGNAIRNTTSSIVNLNNLAIFRATTCSIANPSYGSLLVGNNNSEMQQLPIGSADYYLRVNAAANALVWNTTPSIPDVSGYVLKSGATMTTAAGGVALDCNYAKITNIGALGTATPAFGDIYYRNSSVVTVLPIGTSGQILTTSGTQPSWTTPNYLSAPLSADLSLNGYALTGTIKIGNYATCVSSGIAIGSSAVATGGTDSIAIGNGAKNTTSSTCVIRAGEDLIITDQGAFYKNNSSAFGQGMHSRNYAASVSTSTTVSDDWMLCPNSVLTCQSTNINLTLSAASVYLGSISSLYSTGLELGSRYIRTIGVSCTLTTNDASMKLYGKTSTSAQTNVSIASNSMVPCVLHKASATELRLYVG